MYTENNQIEGATGMNKEWWKEAVGYQVYIRSFKDGNGDGIGDLKGIGEKFEYIKSLGVDFVWICPFYDSPMDDNGYDVRDYYKVAREYGKMSDLKSLVKKAHELGIKVIIDLVLNHTSSSHEWFKKSEQRVAPYTDMYIWKDGRQENGKLLPPNNWQSFFSGSVWEYSKKRKQYYLHIFSKSMPDLNYESEQTIVEIEKVIAFYAELGIDGFRVDAVAHIGKKLGFEDCKLHKFFKVYSNLPTVHLYLKRLHKIFEKYGLFTVGEMGGEPTKKDILRYSDGELDVISNFDQMGVFGKNNTINRKGLVSSLKQKEKLSSNGGWSALFFLNHDYPRFVSKLNGESDARNASLTLATLMYMLKGTPIIYNGEEIGMENYPFQSPKDFMDVNAKMIFENALDVEKEFQNLKENSRDHSRTVMQWNGTKYAGFSEHTPWIYVNPNFKKINVEKEEKTKSSVLNNYKKILQVRKKYIDDIFYGKYKFYFKNGIVGYKICGLKNSIGVLANLSNADMKISNVFKKFDDSKNNICYSNMPYSGMLKPYQVAIVVLNG